MIDLGRVKDIHLYTKAVDMRMWMNKIEMLLSLSFSPLEILHSVFIFISKSKRQLKIYYEDEYGKWLLINKLSYTVYVILSTIPVTKIIRTAFINPLNVERYLAYVLEQIDHVAVEDLLPYSDNLPTHLRMTRKSA